jgi:CoA:oxalate CoA-transferase
MDPILQALSGMMSLTGNTETGPLKLGIPFADLIVPLLSTIGILVAVQGRNTTGRGQRVDLAMIEATIFGMVPRDSYYLATRDEPAGLGNEHNEIVPYNTYATSDGRAIMIIAHTEKFWRIIARAVGAEHLLSDDRLATPADRVRNRAYVNAELAVAFARRTLAEWLAILDAAEAMYAPVQSLGDVFGPAGIGRDYVIDLALSGGGTIELVRNPIHLSETPADIRRPPPRLGEHTEEILVSRSSPTPGSTAAAASTAG